MCFTAALKSLWESRTLYLKDVFVVVVGCFFLLFLSALTFIPSGYFYIVIDLENPH